MWCWGDVCDRGGITLYGRRGFSCNDTHLAENVQWSNIKAEFCLTENHASRFVWNTN